MMKIENVSKSYGFKGGEKWVLQGVNLTMGAGEFVVVKGGDRSGKSTLLGILGLLDFASGGKYHFKGKDISLLSEDEIDLLRNKSIGFVFKNFNFINALTVYENIELPLIYMKLKQEQRKELVNSALEKVGLQHKSKMYPWQLKDWQRKLAAIARAVVANPDLVLVDEPNSALTPTRSESIMKVLTTINEEGTAIIVTTSSGYESQYAHRLLTMQDGHIVADRLTPGISESL